jgi:hypothetical protein
MSNFFALGPSILYSIVFCIITHFLPIPFIVVVDVIVFGGGGGNLRINWRRIIIRNNKRMSYAIHMHAKK